MSAINQVLEQILPEVSEPVDIEIEKDEKDNIIACIISIGKDSGWTSNIENI